MKKIAIIITVFNRKDKTLACLESVFSSLDSVGDMAADVWLTDDGSTDGSAEAIKAAFSSRNINILQGDGSLFWNGGMIKAWTAAIEHGGYDGYLWLNNDSMVLPNLWKELKDADEYSMVMYGKRGIYVGSLTNMAGDKLSYGGFVFTNKITLSDKFMIPNGEFQDCECAHGNITYVSSDVVADRGIFYDRYIHGGTDHDYTYLAHKAGWPVFILREYVGKCDNDHKGSSVIMSQMKLKDRIKFLKSPHGLNLHNTLLFQKRCFPWRVPLAFILGYAKAIFPSLIYNLRRRLF